MLLFSDLHLRPETEDVCFDVLDGVLAEAQVQQIKTIGFLGDFWHLRYQIPVHLLNRACAWVQKVHVQGIKLTMISGNHDQVDEIGTNALDVFSEWGATVYSKPTMDKWGQWLPYRKDPATVANYLSVAQAGSTTLFTHLPIVGALMNNQMIDKDGLSPEHFIKFQKVISGHYHQRQDFLDGRFSYVGSPWQTRADEAGQRKGFAILDSDTRALTYLDRQFGKRYHKFEAVSALSLKQLVVEAQPGKDDLITIQVPTKGDLDAALKLLKKQGFENVTGNSVDLAVPQPRYAFTKGTPLTAYAAAYAAEKGKDIASHDALMAAWMEIAE